ncbi:MAG TPA: hypothetical protein VN920_07535 [Pyrinomonadaceae bacterium]|nr:hypothetical protein [Pyrinomonadaceae bacterium]
MSEKLLAIALGVSLLNVVCGAPIAAGSRESKEAKHAKTMKDQIARVGTGPKARIAIRLRDKTDLRGYVSEAADDHFLMVDEKTSAATSVSYTQVAKVKVMPYVKSAIARDFSTGRIFKTAALGLGLAFSGVIAICLISKRCTE